MEDLSFKALMALAGANKLITGAVVTTLLSVILIKVYWEQVSYFAMRVWHGFPLIGTVARLSRSGMNLDSKQWLTNEVALCNNYWDYYDSISDKDTDYYNKSEAYLDAIGEGDRRERPAWVLILIFLLILFEAVGFAYVLAPFINQNASSNDQTYLAWIGAFLLSILSAGMAEAAGRAIHKNSLVNKARHWWEIDPDKGNTPLKQILPGFRIKNTDEDRNAKDYNRILARLSTNQTVTPRHGMIIGCAAVVLIMACAAFGIRAYQLKSIETEMVGNPNVFAEQNYESAASPFELPSESAAVNQEAGDKTLEDRMDAIRSASLITFVVLSVIYIAIQVVSVWMASIFGFAGAESKKAWEYTHKFNSASELQRWMETQRTRISGHADHKLRMLQMKLSQRPTTGRAIQEAISGAHGRDFNAYAARMHEEAVIRDATATATAAAAAAGQPAVAAPVAQPVPQPAPVAVAPQPAVVAEPVVAPQPVAAPAPVVAPQPVAAPAPVAAVQPAAVEQAAPAAQAGGLDAMRAMDLTRFSEDDLRKVSEKKGLDAEAVLKIRADQILLKEFEGI
ncbi:PXPV repeat protein [Pseudomonas sp. Marseille-P9899]|uniref:PXPV repeat protein n=1 Tax=Pseudomonas sp. Marseille-P9899 TaxID=2730401 RepID=UPI00158F4D77|nr:PXPV repeat protein [Pseudomonas sp. Marseille-P9899]